MTDLQTYLHAAVRQHRDASFARSDQLSLGEIIDKCEAIAAQGREKPPGVRFDFEYLVPDEIKSWRGSYDELAIGFGEGPEPPLPDFIDMLKGAVGEIYEGYKGGEYRMSRDTPVWVANYGHSGNTAIIEVVNNAYEVILITAWREY